MQRSGLAQAGPAAGASIDQAGEQRSARIESVRALAALAVLAGHVYIAGSASPTDSWLDRLVLGGGFGVFLFFVLSGYLLFWPFARRDFGGGDEIDLRGYAINRALRILPLYYVVLVAVLLFQESGGSLKQWLLFGFFLENFDGETVGKVNGVLWSLVVELHFYALLPFLAAGLAWLSRGRLARAGLIVTGLGAVSLCVRLAEVSFPGGPQNQVVVLSMLTTFCFFAVGIGLALLRVRLEHERAAWLTGWRASGDLWLVAAVGCYALLALDYRFDVLVLLASGLVVGACVLPGVRAGALVRGLEWRPLAILGTASYSLYLWHTPIIFWLKTHGIESVGGLAVLGGGISILVALVSYRWVEAPFLRLRRRWTRSGPALLEDQERKAPAGGTAREAAAR